ncbi:unnamed protein product [Cylindrotheca closterium]|uniref:Uncharacterized protein n=1 Tax=Cylindrotheca closterium TaxID=2856 RepID=A0AAD2CN42_9STRA|nr:unnamed protein product [Cylindrotheca closterium]
MTDSSLSTYTCMGTQMVVITSKEDSSSSHPREGLMVVYQKISEGDNTSSDQEPYPVVRIRLGTDQGTYQCDIPQSKVSLSKEKKKRLPEILMQDQASSSNSQSDPIQLSFQFSSEGELKIFLKQKLTSGMSKNAFRDVLQKETNVSLLRFCSDLGEAINGGMSKVTKLQEDLQSTRSNLQQWKETANKLETGGTQEKNMLLKGAYKAWIQNQAKQKKRVEDLTKQLKKGGTSPTNRSPIPGTLAPDDVEQAIETNTMSQSMVEALAEGRGVYNDNERKPILNKKTMNTTWKNDKEDYDKERRAKRRGKTKRSTSSIDEEMEEAPKPSRGQTKKGTKRGRKSSESSESRMLDDLPKPKATRKKASATRMDVDSGDDNDDDSFKKPAAQPTKKRSEPTNYDSSETDADDDDFKPAQKKTRVTPPATSTKAESDDDSDSEDSLLAHMGITSPIKKSKKKASDSDTDDDTSVPGATAKEDSDTDDGILKPEAKAKEESGSDSDTDDGQDKNSNSALVKSLLKTAKKVKENGKDDDWDDF